jgi:hypothetical protein
MKPLEVLDFCVTDASGTGQESAVLSGVSLAAASDPEDSPSLAVSNEKCSFKG